MSVPLASTHGFSLRRRMLPALSCSLALLCGASTRGAAQAQTVAGAAGISAQDTARISGMSVVDLESIARRFASRPTDQRRACQPIRPAYFPATSRSKRGLPRSGAQVGSARSRGPEMGDGTARRASSWSSAALVSPSTV